MNDHQEEVIRQEQIATAAKTRSEEAFAEGDLDEAHRQAKIARLAAIVAVDHAKQANTSKSDKSAERASHAAKDILKMIETAEMISQQDKDLTTFTPEEQDAIAAYEKAEKTLDEEVAATGSLSSRTWEAQKAAHATLENFNLDWNPDFDQWERTAA